MQNNNQKLLIAGAAASLLIAAGYYVSTRSHKDTKQKVLVDEQITTTFTDPEKGTLHYLTKKEAFGRSSVVANVSYRLSLALVTGGQSYFGHVTANFTLN